MSQSERSDALSTIGMGNIRIVLTNQVSTASDRISFHFNNPVNPPQAMSHGVNINAVNAVCLIGAFDR